MARVNAPVDICNMALLECGVPAIESFDEESVEAAKCKAAYGYCLDILLREHHWNFATKVVETTPVVTDLMGPPNYKYAYQYPADCVRIYKVDTGRYMDFKVVGDLIFSRSKLETLTYISNAIPVSSFDPAFVDALALLIASKLIYGFTQSNNSRLAMKRLYEDNLAKAKSYDVVTETTDDLETDVFLDARY